MDPDSVTELSVEDAGPGAPRTARRLAGTMLGVLAFVVLAVALCSRPLLNEDRTVPVEHLVNAPEAASSASLMVRHVVHLLAAGGIVLAVLWIVLSRRRWRLCGLEAAALVMTGAALLSVPVASDKRLAINATIDGILPLVAAAGLYQLLSRRPTWRRVVLAAVVAATAANCAKATAKWWEYRQQWNDYQQQKAEFWSQRKVSLDDPQVVGYEAFLRARRPISFIQGPNVTSSLLILGLTGVGAAVLGCGWRRERAQANGPASSQPPAIEALLAPSPPLVDAPAGPSDEPPAAKGPIETFEPPSCDPSLPPEDLTPCPEPGREVKGCEAVTETPGSAAGKVRPATKWLLFPAAALLPLVLWHLVVLAWIHTAGSMVALLTTLAAGAVGLRMRDRPRRLAIVLAGGLVLLQTCLVVLALSPTDVRSGFLNSRVAGGKIKTLGLRLFLYESGIRLFLGNPVTGVGPSQFDKRYLPYKPAYVPLLVADAHNWLVTAAACGGVLGLLGVLVAVGGSGWMILRSLARPPDAFRWPVWAALLPTVLIVLACWLIVMSDMPRSLWAKILPFPVGASLVAGILVSLCRLDGRMGHLVLLAGLVGFVVHCTAEITASVPDVMWPFWAVVALAMAWNGPARALSRRPLPRCIASTAPLQAGGAALAVAVLTIQPMQAVGLMHQAQRAAMQNDLEPAVTLLRSAAAADPLDPLPLKAAALLRYKIAQADRTQAIEHYRDYAELSRAAVERNPLDYTYWRSLALANMFLGTATEDFALVGEAIRDMRRALELNPQWPGGWLELARMAAVEGGGQGDQVALLQAALDAANRALSLEDSRPEGVAPSLTPQDRAELLRMREQLSRRLKAAAGRSIATQTAR
jgi:hypothetical protein